MNLTDIFAWVEPLDHKAKLVCIYLNKLQDNYYGTWYI